MTTKNQLFNAIKRLKHEHKFVHTGIIIGVPVMITIAVLSAFHQDYHTAWNALGITMIASSLYETYHSVVKAILKLYETQVENETI